MQKLHLVVSNTMNFVHEFRRMNNNCTTNTKIIIPNETEEIKQTNKNRKRPVYPTFAVRFDADAMNTKLTQNESRVYMYVCMYR